MEYITIFQNDHKDNFHRVYFCQLTGYEDVIARVWDILTDVDEADDIVCEHGYTFSYNRNPLAESAVDALAGMYTKGHNSNINFMKLGDSNRREYEIILRFVEQTCRGYLSYE